MNQTIVALLLFMLKPIVFLVPEHKSPGLGYSVRLQVAQRLISVWGSHISRIALKMQHILSMHTDTVDSDSCFSGSLRLVSTILIKDHKVQTIVDQYS